MQPTNSTVNFTHDYAGREVLGVVVGIAVCERDFSSHPATLDNIRAARKAALDDMNAQAKELDAHAVIGIRFDNSLVSSTQNINHTVEYTAYGTAVKLRETEQESQPTNH